MPPYKNLIFDLGDVIIDIDYKATVAEFQKLAAQDFDKLLSYSTQHHVFDLFETGKISARQFRNELKKFLKTEVTDAQIDQAWNAIMIDFPEHKFALLKDLKSRYRVYALSNINEIHVSTINEAVRKRFGAESFSDYFHTAYYSNEVGFRKPGKEIYELVLRKENLNPAETIFIDDKAENVEAARKIGLHAHQLKDRNKLFELLTELKIIP